MTNRFALSHDNGITGAPGRRAELTFRGNVRRGRHGWLRLTPAYSLHVVEGIIAQCAPNEVVLDPFSGTGTTVLAASVHGLNAHAIDINPFLVWLGNLKVQRFAGLTALELRKHATKIVAAADRSRGQAWVPSLHAIEKWWPEDTLRKLANLYESLDQSFKNSGDFAFELLRIAFCRVLIETANVSFGHQSMSFKKRSSQKTLFDATDEVGARFLQAVDDLAEGILTDEPRGEARVFLGDSRCPPAAIPWRSYTRVITSPPYPNRMSYIRELRPYMYWLGYLSNGREAGELDWQAIGGTWGCATSLLNTWEPHPASRIKYPAFMKIINAIAQNHAILARYVHKYFEDIGDHIRSLKEVLAPKARCHYVVGNSKFYDTLLPVEEIYAALFEDAGYTDVTIDVIRKRNSKKELYEFVVAATRN